MPEGVDPFEALKLAVTGYLEEQRHRLKEILEGIFDTSLITIVRHNSLVL